MKRPGCRFVQSTLIVSFTLLLLSPAAAVRIKIATKAPQNFKSARLIRQMTKEIEEKTDGKVRFKVYYGGVKGTGRDLLLKMKGGEIQGGEFTAGEASSVVKDLRVMSIPFAFNSYDEVDFVFKEMSPYLRRELENRGYMVLGWLEVGFAYIMSTEPIASLDDLKGKKVWIPQGDPVGQAAFQAMGVPPIPMTIADVMVGLQTGQINTVANSLYGAIALQWHTSIRYVTDVPLLYVYGLLMVTRDAYERIPAEYRQTVQEILDRTFLALKMDMRKNNRESRQTLIRQGIRFVPVPKDRVRELSRIIDGVNRELSGKAFSEEALRRMQEALRTYRASHPGGGT